MGRIIGSTESSGFLTLNSTYAEKMATAWPLSRYSVEGIAPALNLDFKEGQYRLGKTGSTFADAFTGTSPKLTYSTAAGSNSTMVNSSGNIVWAPHNLHRYSSDISSWASTANVTASSSSGNELGDIPTTLLTATGGSAQHRAFDVTLSEANPVTFSFYIKPGTFDYVQFHDGTTTTYWADFDLTGNGSVIRHQNFDATPTIEAVTSAGQTFFKITVQYTSIGTTTLPIISFPDPSTVVSSGTRNPTWTAAGTETLYIGGIHIYRSDLGGMHPVPGADTGFEYYVPTNGNAEYLPRVGHHVYNGTAWVNEGLLIESEARLNLFSHSNDFSGNWVKNNSPTVTANASTGPDGALSMSRITGNGSQGSGVYEFVSNPTGVASYTFSVFIRGVSNAGNIRIRLEGSSLSNSGIRYDAHNAAFVSNEGAAPDAYAIEDFGNDIYRVSITATTTGTGTLAVVIYDWSTAGAVFDIYGAQLEIGSNPSSYIPTNGGTYTRTAQSFTVPALWYDTDNPTYTGPELVDVANDAAAWTAYGTNTIADVGDAVEVTYVDNTSGAYVLLENAGGLSSDLTVGVTYRINLEVKSNSGNYGIRIRNGSFYEVSDIPLTNTAYVAKSYTITPTNSTGVFIELILLAPGEVVSIRNISVRQRTSAPQFGWNSDAVSFQMDGRMTYADEDVAANVTWWQWLANGSNYVEAYYATDGFYDRSKFTQGSIVEQNASNDSRYLFSPGINVPFNIAARYGSTFVNGAVDGTALPGDTTPTALPDLSNTDLQIAYDFMGTIGTFRQFAGDIGDDGLETSSDPGPSLSLTFDGSSTSSFLIN